MQSSGGAVDAAQLERMRDTMTHRGPDTAGLYRDGAVGLGHRRLRIIDLSDAAAQPMSSDDGEFVVVHNGEIYNFQELRRELEAKGHRFRSRSDTEVILHGYREWGAHCVEHFNGMFAFAVYHRSRGELFIARDRLGIKPLYYRTTPEGLQFASEVKAFFALTGVTPELDDAQLIEQLLYRSFVGGATLFRGIRMLAPGHWMRVHRDGQVTTEAYWDLVPGPSIDAPMHELEEEVMALLQESVELQQVGDVPIGVQLSGGIDSALVAGAMTRSSRGALASFTVGFEEPEFNELDQARAVAGHFHTEHHEVIQQQQDFADQLDRATWHHDEPLAHSNAMGIYSLCRIAKPFATVLLTGEGADETFAGYHRHEWIRKHALAQRWLAPFAPLLPRAHSGHLASLRLALTRSPQEFVALSTARGLVPFGAHLDPATMQQVITRRARLQEPARGQSPLNRTLYHDLKSYLPPILMRQDKMSMAHGVETRVPFLDHRLVELAFRLPPGSRLHRGIGKWILKRIASRELPAALAWRPKNGFSFPLAPWLRTRGPLAAQLDRVLASDSLSRRLLPEMAIRGLIDQHQRGEADHAEAIWSLLALESWKTAFFG